MTHENEAISEFIGRYCQRWVWDLNDLDAVKTYLPFFDKVSLILPTEWFDQAVDQDPVLALPLSEKGILVNRDPSDALQGEWGKLLTETLRDLFDRLLVRHRLTKNNTIGAFHFGDKGKEQEELLQNLRDKGLASEPGRDGLFKVDADVFEIVMHTCANVMCLADKSRGIDSVPFMTETRWNFHGVTQEYWLPTLLSADIAAVGFNLSSLPLDEVLDIRSEHGPAYRSYLRGLRESARALDVAAPSERMRMFADREVEILDLLSDLKRKTRIEQMKRTVTVGLGTAAGSWGFASGNIIGGAIATAAALVGFIKIPDVTSIHTYLFTVADYER